MIELRSYQTDIAQKAYNLLLTKKIAYLAMAVRTGKTLTALYAAERYLTGCKTVLFITKKKAIKSIQDDYNSLKPPYKIVIINYESLHTIERNDFNLIVCDEAHKLGAFPKPNNIQKAIKKRFGHLPMIFLSGTAAAESGSQWYHQFAVSNHSPFKEKSFYRWADTFVNPKIKYIGALQVKDYSDAKVESIMPIIEPYLLTYTQEEAGFTSKVSEQVIYFEMSENTKRYSEKLLKDGIIQGNSDVILADTPGKLMSKIHQIENGTVILESGNSIILDRTKAKFINETFRGEKIAIFYYFQAELELLCECIDNCTTDLEEFNTSDKNLIIQQYSGAEGISLKNAESLIFYNWSHSGIKYIQSRDRMTTKEREVNKVYFVMQKKSLNEKIYRCIKNKKKFSESVFKKEYNL